MLHIIRHISLLDTLLTVRAADPRDVWIISSECFNGMIPWIEDAISLPAHGMPENAFAQMIRDIAERESIVRYDGDVGELWDRDQFFSERKAWTEDQWVTDWDKMVRAIFTDRWRYIANKYSVEPEILRTTYTVVRNGRVIKSTTRGG